MKKILFTFISLSLFSCVKDNNYNLPDTKSILEQKSKKYNEYNRSNIISYTDLKNKINSNVQLYTEDNAFEGYVISSDEGGNFYKEIYVQAIDKSGTIIVAIDKKGLYSEFPIGSKVQVRLKGTSIWEDPRYAVIKVGYGESTTSGGNKKISNLPSAMYENVIIPSGEVANIEDITTSFDNLSTIKSDASSYKLVLLKNVRFTDASVGKTFYNPTDQYNTTHKIKDQQNKELELITSSFASFIKDIVPSGNLNIRGIITIYKGKNTTNKNFQFKINNITDIQRTN